MGAVDHPFDVAPFYRTHRIVASCRKTMSCRSAVRPTSPAISVKLASVADDFTPMLRDQRCRRFEPTTHDDALIAIGAANA